jgi:hypothetical protein
MLNVNFNSYNNYIVDTVTQWDVNRKLTVAGLNLATAPEIHFWSKGMTRAIVKQATLTSSGVVECNIPNSLLQSPLKIYASIGVYEDDTFKTVETIEIPVVERVKPEDYTLEDGDEELYSFKALENAISMLCVRVMALETAINS